MIEVGEQAPDFTLRDQDGEKVSLSDFRGRKVMLVFYPGDFSPVCGDQLSIYQEVKPQIVEQGVELVGISVDSSYAHKAFQEKIGIDTTCSPTSTRRARSPAPTAPTSTSSASPTARWFSSTRTE
ncbi:MAG TPA: peroxiredoxin family protein, partial [Solirubrobacterales bacterium]|nr:peroxiredoxin family protein [Solirubrobacterales bacterium]